MKINSIYYWILFSIFLLFACNKKDVIQKEDYKEFKDWLNINGQVYKEGTLNKISADGKIQQLNLDWSNTSSYKVDGIDYTEVQFVNNNSGNDDFKSATNIINNSESDDVAFSMVFRNRLGKIEGALKLTHENAEVKKEGLNYNGSIEFFYDYGNKLLNTWFFDNKTSVLTPLRRELSGHSENISLSTASQNVADDCDFWSIPLKEYQCWEEPDNPTLVGYPVVCGYVYAGIKSFSHCKIIGGGGNGDVGGGGSSGGGPSGPSGAPTWPSKRQPPDLKNKPCPTSGQALLKAFPSSSPSKMGTLATLLNKYGEQFGINSNDKLRHFLAQCAVETGGFVTLNKRESMWYSSASRIVEVWPKRFSTWDPRKSNPYFYTNNPEKLANKVYGGRMGNTNPGDGYKFIGRGLLQLTGRETYTEFMKFYNNNFPNHIDPVNDPKIIETDTEISVVSALWEFQKSVLKKIDVNKNTSVDAVTYRVNGGYTDLDKRKNAFAAAKTFIDCL